MFVNLCIAVLRLLKLTITMQAGRILIADKREIMRFAHGLKKRRFAVKFSWNTRFAPRAVF